jgi:hypothetical protein
MNIRPRALIFENVPTLGLYPTLCRTFKYNKYKFKVGTYSEIVTVSMEYNLVIPP